MYAEPGNPGREEDGGLRVRDSSLEREEACGELWYHRATLLLFLNFTLCICFSFSLFISNHFFLFSAHLSVIFSTSIYFYSLNFLSVHISC